MTSSSAQRLARVLITSVGAVYVLIGLWYFAVSPGYGLVAAGLIVAVAALHFVTMRAALRDPRPPLFPLLPALQAVATYAPDLFLPMGWSGVAAPMLGGAVLVTLPLRFGGPLVGLMTLYSSAAIFPYNPVVALFYGLTIPLTGGMVYALVRLVRVTSDLEQARAELAEAAVLRERLRISRDLHDGLGRSLTAIALKGDLAGRLMERDPAAARDEVGELVRVAREAAQDVRQVARGYRELSLAGEANRGAALLESAGVGCQVHLADVTLPRPAEEALAWGVREAVTNVLRHSAATTCTIATSRHAGSVRLEVTNDGVPGGGEPSANGNGPTGSSTGSGPTGSGPTGNRSSGDGLSGDGKAVPGGGLTGLAERAAHAGGTVDAGRTPAGGFRLTMEVPA
ncbi:sensor histidine kinase [Nonomuraea roseoviolacea]|uniref:Two-component system sensor histidine kinase DesK n=1 Tax=Nonomuraea roseoviolacea subsp. carminata TaxID=160689 RepID=A0ABT1JS60_9ACTN|nr:sensor histidine kinase [Nonomuraea roseoviolacea]MCP2344582.1 two-component system sensor histidine kinase DesK [Nonomuraea roseoviolacea subsp. carminata]